MMRALMTKTLFVLSILLSAQALAFDVGGLSYSVIGATNGVRVEGCAADLCASSDVVLPATVVDSGITYDVKRIGSSAFSSNALTSVIIPDSVTIIGGFAFSNNDLTSVTIGTSVTTIGGGAFNSNPLANVVIPDSVTTIGDYAFQSNALTSVTIGNSVTTIGDYAFQNNPLANVVIPDSVTTIGDYAFQSNDLTSVTIETSVTTIGVAAFESNALTSVIIPDSVTTIGGGAFSSNALTSVIIPDSVTTIGGGAFSYNPITSAAFEGDFGDFQLNMFETNFNLTTITYCEGTTSWPQSFNTGSTIRTTAPLNCSTAPPDAPTIDSIAPGNGQAIITLTPGADYFFPITGYTTYCLGDTLFFGASPTSPITVSGLTNGEAYVCAATAMNDFGTSPASEFSAPFTPAAPPDAPLITGILPGDEQAIINLTAGDDGGSPITGYTAYCFGDTLSFGASPTSPIAVSGLTNGVSYTCAVTATNDIGDSPASAFAPVTPLAPPPGCGLDLMHRSGDQKPA